MSKYKPRALFAIQNELVSLSFTTMQKSNVAKHTKRKKLTGVADILVDIKNKKENWAGHTM